MSDVYGPRSSPTKPMMPRVWPDEGATSVGNEDVTKVRCPVCVGAGMVPPDVALLAETALAMRKDET